jgi:hypothetical protein
MRFYRVNVGARSIVTVQHGESIPTQVALIKADGDLRMVLSPRDLSTLLPVIASTCADRGARRPRAAAARQSTLHRPKRCPDPKQQRRRAGVHH